MMTTARPGSQLSAVLHALGGGRGTPQPWVADIPWGPATWLVDGRTFAAGYSKSVADRFAVAYSELDVRAQRQVSHPLLPDDDSVIRFGDDAALQVNESACGPAVLAMLAAAGDPTVAYWIVTGEDLAADDPAVRMRSAAIDQQMAKIPADSPGERFASLQIALQYRVTHRGAFPTWPRRYGTPPWAAAQEARFGKIRYESRLVNDLNDSNLRKVLTPVLGAVSSGVAVPLYVGGDSHGGSKTAMPRHVVLLHSVMTAKGELQVVPDQGSLATYEPSSARIIGIEPEQLARGGVPRDAFGHWSHVAWAIVPRRDSRGW